MVARLLLVLLWGVLALPAWAQSWNYAYILPAIPDFRSVAVDVVVEGEFKTGQKVFVAPFHGRLGGSTFYFGMQTDLHDGRDGRFKGKGLIFSRWGAVEPGDARPAPGAWTEAQTHAQSREGDFVGLRLPYEWRPGRYTFRLEMLGQWGALSMQDHGAGRHIDLGSLRFPADPPAKLSSGGVGFVEFYGALPAQPRFTVRFGPPRINGAIRPEGGQVMASKLPTGLARITPTPDGGVTMQVGAP